MVNIGEEGSLNNHPILLKNSIISWSTYYNRQICFLNHKLLIMFLDLTTFPYHPLILFFNKMKLHVLIMYLAYLVLQMQNIVSRTLINVLIIMFVPFYIGLVHIVEAQDWRWRWRWKKREKMVVINFWTEKLL